MKKYLLFTILLFPLLLQAQPKKIFWLRDSTDALGRHFGVPMVYGGQIMATGILVDSSGNYYLKTDVDLYFLRKDSNAVVGDTVRLKDLALYRAATGVLAVNGTLLLTGGLRISANSMSLDSIALHGDTVIMYHGNTALPLKSGLDTTSGDVRYVRIPAGVEDGKFLSWDNTWEYVSHSEIINKPTQIDSLAAARALQVFYTDATGKLCQVTIGAEGSYLKVVGGILGWGTLGEGGGLETDPIASDSIRNTLRPEIEALKSGKQDVANTVPVADGAITNNHFPWMKDDSIDTGPMTGDIMSTDTPATERSMRSYVQTHTSGVVPDSAKRAALAHGLYAKTLLEVGDTTGFYLARGDTMYLWTVDVDGKLIVRRYYFGTGSSSSDSSLIAAEAWGIKGKTLFAFDTTGITALGEDHELYLNSTRDTLKIREKTAGAGSFLGNRSAGGSLIDDSTNFVGTGLVDVTQAGRAIVINGAVPDSVHKAGEADSAIGIKGKILAEVADTSDRGRMTKLTWDTDGKIRSINDTTYSSFVFGCGMGAAGDTAVVSDTADYGGFYNKYDTLIVTSLMGIVKGASPSITADVQWHTTEGSGSATHLISSPPTITSTTTGDETTSFNNSKIPPGVFVWMTTPTVTVGVKPIKMRVTMTFIVKKSR